MGSDDIFKKRRAERKQRRHEYRIPRANSFLIVTEGKRTEPLYFNGMKRLIEKKTGGNIDVVENPVIDISGEGCSTGKLIKVTDRIVKDAKHRLGNGKYQKNYENIYDLVNIDDGVNAAPKNTKRRMAEYGGGRYRVSEYDPGTTVYKLVEELKRYLDE